MEGTEHTELRETDFSLREKSDIYQYVPLDRLQDCVAVHHIPAAFSDHLAVGLVLRLAGGVGAVKPKPRRSSYWKLNNLILEDPDFILNFTDMYGRVRESIMEYDDICYWWEYRAKPMLITFLKQYSGMLARERKQTMEALYIMLEEALGRAVEGYQEAVLLKQRISDLLVVAAEGLKIRSRFKENLEKEKASLFHLAREKKKAMENNIEKLLIGGVECSDRKVCEEEVINFYEPLTGETRALLFKSMRIL